MAATQPDQPARNEYAPPQVEQWFAEAVPRLYGYFLVRVGGRVDLAEDLTQETVIAAASARHGPAPDTPIMAWLFGIARHKLMDHFRLEERTRRHFGNRVDGELLAFGVAPTLGGLDLDALDVRDAVVTTLDSLLPSQRAALIFRHFDGRTVIETAEQLGLSLHATESLLARARSAFRQAYASR